MTTPADLMAAEVDAALALLNSLECYRGTSGLDFTADVRRVIARIAAAGREGIVKVEKHAQIIAETLEAIDNRCMAVDGPVSPTLQEARPGELRKIYRAAVAIRAALRTLAGPPEGEGNNG